MSEYMTSALSLLAGLLLGSVFFGGLWWTVRALVTTQRPALLLLTSVVIRVGITLVGFYFVGGTEWKRWLACLVGFVLARFAVSWLSRTKSERSVGRTRKARYAP